MKFTNIVKILGVLVVAISFTGCFSTSSQLIKVEKLDNGSKAYSMWKSSVDIKDPKYRGIDIDDYQVGVYSEGDTVSLYFAHYISFTIGTGTPSTMYCQLCPKKVRGVDVRNDPKDFNKRRWNYERFWKGLEKVDVVGLGAKSYGNVIYSQGMVFDIWTEKIRVDFDKKDFINFVKKNQYMSLNIKTKKGNYNNIKVTNYDRIKKFVDCLENEKNCVKGKKK